MLLLCCELQTEGIIEIFTVKKNKEMDIFDDVFEEEQEIQEQLELYEFNTIF